MRQEVIDLSIPPQYLRIGPSPELVSEPEPIQEEVGYKSEIFLVF